LFHFVFYPVQTDYRIKEIEIVKGIFSSSLKPIEITNGCNIVPG
jgi:hypothetical protein